MKAWRMVSGLEISKTSNSGKNLLSALVRMQQVGYVEHYLHMKLRGDYGSRLKQAKALQDFLYPPKAKKQDKKTTPVPDEKFQVQVHGAWGPSGRPTFLLCRGWLRPWCCFG